MNSRSCCRAFSGILAVLLGWTQAPPAATVQAAPNFEADVWPYFQAHGLGCHGEAKQEGEFRIDLISRAVGLEHTPQWAEVIGRMTSGEMPPADVPHPPTADETAAIVRWLATRLEEGEAARLARVGPPKSR